MPGTMIICGQCKSMDLAEVLTPDGPHYGKLSCRACGRFLKWLPRPSSSVMPEVVRPLGLPAAVLRGTPPQVSAAESIRVTLLRDCRRDGRRDIADVVSSVTDASWFLANKDRRIEALKWPSESQMESLPVSSPTR